MIYSPTLATLTEQFVAQSINKDNNDKQLTFTAEVVDVILDSAHKDYTIIPYIGAIKYRTFNTYGISTNNISSWAIPLDLTVQKTPLIGEYVIIINSISINTDNSINLRNAYAYYISTVSFLNSCNSNLGKGMYLSGSKPDIIYKDELHNKTFSDNKNSNYYLYEGDININGRFGQSLIFSSTVNNLDKNIRNQFASKQDGSDNGSPITILVNDRNSNYFNYHIDNGYSIYSSNQKIKLINPIFDKNYKSFNSLISDWTSLSYGNVNDIVTEFFLEEIQSKNNISIDPRSLSTYFGPDKIDDTSTSYISPNGIPVYNQGDYRWAYLKDITEPYTMKSSGCALCSMSMVLSYLLLDINLTPDKLFKIKNKIIVHWSDIIKYINSTYNKKYAVYHIKTPKNMNEIDALLEMNIPVIIESKNKNNPSSGFTIKNDIVEYTGTNQKPYVCGNQHWMVITAKNSDGTYDLHDPNGARIRKNQSNSDILLNLNRITYIS